jgi:hypothetical protein
LVGSGRGIILKYYPGIRLEGLRITTKTSIRIAGRRGRDLNPGTPEYEAGVLTDDDDNDYDNNNNNNKN